MISVSLARLPFSFSEELCSPYFECKTPAFSYLYSSFCREDYRFEDPEMEQVSLRTSLEITEKKVIFTFNLRHAVYYDHSFIYSISKFIEKIKPPKNLDKDMLEKIAIVANYLSKGEEYEYLTGTAKQTDTGLHFLVKKGTSLCQAILTSLKEDAEVCYQKSQCIDQRT